MADTETARVVLAGPESDSIFCGVTKLLTGLDLEISPASSKYELLLLLFQTEVKPAVVLLSSAIDEKDLGILIRDIKKESGAEVIVCATQSNREREIQARRAGIFCYLVLPDEEEFVCVALQAALARHKSRCLRDSL